MYAAYIALGNAAVMCAKSKVRKAVVRDFQAALRELCASSEQILGYRRAAGILLTTLYCI